jgi:hypothetical protein
MEKGAIIIAPKAEKLKNETISRHHMGGDFCTKNTGPGAKSWPWALFKLPNLKGLGLENQKHQTCQICSLRQGFI